jgi:50S ribosomal protein L16 3-hydroxylase
MQLNWPKNLDEKRFLQEYWQKKPLFIKNAFPDLQSPLSAEELAGLACEPDAESRIITHQRENNDWELLQGPFEESVFGDLPAEDWTLLVQDIDKLVDGTDDFLKPFRFIPDWRIDDLMISYAVTGGSVGPHTDSYDVFLLQLKGCRQWKIDQRPGLPRKLLEGLPVRVLEEFITTDEWRTEPGDLLYLPPNLPHWGIALDDKCMTGSVGFVSPRESELFESWSDEVLSSLSINPVYADPDLQPQSHPAEISRQSLDKISQALDRLIDESRNQRDAWIGKMLSRSKSNLFIEPPEETLPATEVRQIVQQCGLLRHPYLRLFFSRQNNGNFLLFANGEAFEISREHAGFVEYLCAQQHYLPAELIAWLEDSENLQLVTELFNRGYLEQDEDQA